MKMQPRPEPYAYDNLKVQNHIQQLDKIKQLAPLALTPSVAKIFKNLNKSGRCKQARRGFSDHMQSGHMVVSGRMKLKRSEEVGRGWMQQARPGTVLEQRKQGR